MGWGRGDDGMESRRVLEKWPGRLGGTPEAVDGL